MTRFTLIGVIIGAACVTPPQNPFPMFRVPMETLDIRGKRIALVPLLTPNEIEDPESLIVRFDSMIESQLRASNVEIVPAIEYRRIWERLNQEAGGFYDPFTGIRDDVRYDAAVERLLAEVRERYDPVGFLYPELWVVEAPVGANIAEWDGTAERLAATPGTGTVLAASFTLALEATDGSILFENGKGLMVMEELDLATGFFVPIPRERLFTDWVELGIAVEEVLAPLIEALKPTIAVVPLETAVSVGAGSLGRENLDRVGGETR